MTEGTLAEAQRMAKTVTDGLGGYGIFGVELFVKGEEVIFSELSPRPHDTGMVTMISQNLSQFALHTRAILGLPIPNIRQYGPAASHVIMGKGDSMSPSFVNVDSALKEEDTDLRLFGKPEVKGERRLGVCLALGDSIEEARDKAERASRISHSHIVDRRQASGDLLCAVGVNILSMAIPRSPLSVKRIIEETPSDEIATLMITVDRTKPVFLARLPKSV